MIKKHFETVGNCSEFVEIGSDVTCSVDEMKTLLASQNVLLKRTQPFQFDHMYPGVVQDDIPVVILYAEIGSKSFAAFHDVLAELAVQQKVKYILRHYILVGWRSAMICLHNWCVFY